jgi:hypothetical protein
VYKDKSQVPANVIDVLEQFTTMVCVWFAGSIWADANTKKTSRKKP